MRNLRQRRFTSIPRGLRVHLLLAAIALLLGACSGEDSHDVGVFFASQKPRAGYAEAVAPGHDTLYVR